MATDHAKNNANIISQRPFLHSLGRLPPTEAWLESSLSTHRFIVAMIVS